ncbi:head-tail connector protein [Sphingomonas sp.]|uniref:head-tail connector protein n=1 Tax=Sphingomonas sp. TaxID=28214 RepID=UPI003CC548CC
MAASAVPVSVLADLAGAARGYLRVGESVEAGLLARLAETAVTTAEAFCGTVIVQRQAEDVLAVSAAWQRLATAPVTAIMGVTALPAGAAPLVLPVDAYAVDIDAGGDGWVRVTAAGGAAQLAVSYMAGRATSLAAVPAALAQGMVLLVAHLFEHRDGDVLPPAAVAALWRPFRVMRLATQVHV